MLWSYILTVIGLAGFYLAGKKVWWCWYVNIANQVLWVAYALVTKQYGFLIGAAGYLYVFLQNAVVWTKEHRANAPSGLGRGEYDEYISYCEKDVQATLSMYEGLHREGKGLDKPIGLVQHVTTKPEGLVVDFVLNDDFSELAKKYTEMTEHESRFFPLGIDPEKYSESEWQQLYENRYVRDEDQKSLDEIAEINEQVKTELDNHIHFVPSGATYADRALCCAVSVASVGLKNCTSDMYEVTCPMYSH